MDEKNFTLRFDVRPSRVPGLINLKFIYQRPGFPDEIVLEKTQQLSQAKQLVDGIFQQLYEASGTNTC